MDKEALVKIIQESIPGINEQGVAAIMSNIRLETDDFKSLHEYAMDHDRIFEKKDGKYVLNIPSIRKNLTNNGYGPNASAAKIKEYNELSETKKLGIEYMGDKDTPYGGGTGPLMITFANYGGNEVKKERMEQIAKDMGYDDFNVFMSKVNTDAEFGLEATLAYYKKYEPNKFTAESLNNTTAQELGDEVINPGRDWISDSDWKTYTNEGNTIAKNHYTPVLDEVYVIDYDTGEPYTIDGDYMDANSEEGQILIADGTGYSQTKSTYEKMSGEGVLIDEPRRPKKPKKKDYKTTPEFRRAEREYYKKLDKWEKAQEKEEELRPEDIVTDEEEEIKEKETIQLAIGKGDKGHLSNDQQNKLEELGIELQIRTDENGLTFYEIKADDIEEANKIMTKLNEAGFENQYIVGQPDNKKKIEKQVENVITPQAATQTEETRYQIVLDAQGNEIRIPIGPDVTEQEIEQETQTEQKYDSWKDLFDNIDNIDKSQPVYVGNNKFKWQESADNNFVLINEDGEELTGEEYSHIYDSQREARLNRETPPESDDDAETSKKYSIGDVIKKGDYTPFEGNDGNLISDQDLTITGINADGTYEVQGQNGQIMTINPADQGQRIENNQIVVSEDPAPIIKQESSRITNADGSITVNYTDGTFDTIAAPVADTTADPADTGSVDEETEEEGPNLFQKIGGGVGATLKGAGTLLDSIGGPSAIISYIMGKEGLKHAMKEIEPQKMPELSPLFHQHLRQTKELAKKGFHPAEARKMRREIDAAYEKGLDTAIRGTAGDRAKFLAHSGVLDAKRSSALIDFATQDAALQRENQSKYVDTMMFKENFEAQRSEKLRAEDMQMQLANKQSAAQFTSAAFSNLMSGLGGGNTALIRQMMQMYQSGQNGTNGLFSGINPE